MTADVESARDFAAASLAPNTVLAYASDWKVFTAWCASRGLRALPATPAVVATYIGALGAGSVPGRRGVACVRRPSTIKRHLAAITREHARAGVAPSPCADEVVRATRQGIGKKLGARRAQKTAILNDLLRRLVDALPDDRTRTRDRALLLLGWAGAFRRSELVALDVADVDTRRDATGMRVFVRRAKNDQDAKGRYAYIARAANPAICPVAAVERLCAELATVGVVRGPLFRSASRRTFGERLAASHVARLVKTAVQGAGIDPASYAGHSLRSGFITTAHRAGRSLRDIQDHTGHASLAGVEPYIRSEPNWERNAGKGLL